MAKLSSLSTDTPWLRLETTDEDWIVEDPADHARWLEQLFVIRRFEEKILDLHGRGLVHGPAHPSPTSSSIRGTSRYASSATAL